MFDYCDVVWDNLDLGLATKLQKLQNRAARIITFWRQKHLSLLMYDAINKNVPSYISDLFSKDCENNPYKYKLRNKEHNVMLGRTPKTEYSKGSFSYRGGLLWNSLPNAKRAAVTRYFRAKLDIFLFT